jgi:hypothetical protein
MSNARPDVPLWSRFVRVGALAVALVAFAAESAQATSCAERRIAAMSIQEAAESIWDNSDVIGFGVIESVNTLEREQQFIEMLVTLKGPSNQRLDYVPLRVGRIAMNAPGYYRQDPGRDGVAFLTLVRVEEGYLVPACQELLLAKDRPAIIRRLVAMAARRK